MLNILFGYSYIDCFASCNYQIKSRRPKICNYLLLGLFMLPTATRRTLRRLPSLWTQMPAIGSSLPGKKCSCRNSSRYREGKRELLDYLLLLLCRIL